MAAGKPVKIAILADAREAVQGFNKAGDAAKDAGATFDGIAEKSDNLASASSQVAGGLGDLGGALSSLPGPLGALGTGMEAAAPAIMGVTGAADLLNVATAKFPILAKAQVIATNAVAVAQRALNAVMRMSPFGLLMLAIGALLLVLPLIVKNWDKIKAATERVWGAIKTVITTVINAIKTGIMAVFNAIKSYVVTVFGFYRSTITGAWDKIRNSTTATWNAIRTFITGAWDKIKTAVRDAITKVVDFVRGIKDKVLGALAGAGEWLKNAGSRIIEGLWNGLKKKWEEVKDWFADITSGIPDLKGPPSRDAKLLTKNGELIIGSLLRGFENTYPAVEKSLQGLTRDLSGFDASVGGGLTLDARGALAASGRSQVMRIEMTLTAEEMSALERGRKTQMDLDVYAKAGGRRRA